MAASWREKYLNRDSGIELLKIIAIFLIVLNHCIQSITEASGIMPPEALFNTSQNTTDIVTILLMILRSSGCLGNDIFVACSAWFMVGSKGNGKKKILFLLVEVWVVSVMMLIVSRIIGTSVSLSETLQSFLPTTSGTNWFVTCYILLLFVYPFLNRLIEGMSQKKLLGTTLVLLLLYSLIHFFRPWFVAFGAYLMTDLIQWIMIYFLIAYVKLYLKDFSSSVKANVIIIIIGLAGQIIMILLNNFAGLRFETLAGRGLYYNYGGSPFFLLITLGALNLARKGTFKCSFINYLSGLSLLTYIIHENQIVRYSYRPLIFKYIYDAGGFDHVILWLFVVALAIFVAAMLISAAFKETVERIIRRFTDWLYGKLALLYHKLESKLLKLH